MLLILKYKYLVLFPILVLEGPITTIVCGALASSPSHPFNIPFLFIFIIFCDIAGDSIYYVIGRFAGKKLIKKFTEWRGKEKQYDEVLKDYFKKHGGKTVSIGKISHGLGWPVMVAAGSAHMDYFLFCLYGLLISIPKSALLLAIGYYYGKDYTYIVDYLGGVTNFVSITVAIVIIVLIARKKLSDRI